MKVKIESGNAPKAIGPYSQAVLVDDTLYVSGNIPVNPKSGDVADGIVNQSKQVFENMKAVLNEAGKRRENNGFPYRPFQLCDVQRNLRVVFRRALSRKKLRGSQQTSQKRSGRGRVHRKEIKISPLNPLFRRISFCPFRA